VNNKVYTGSNTQLQTQKLALHYTASKVAPPLPIISGLIIDVRCELLSGGLWEWKLAFVTPALRNIHANFDLYRIARAMSALPSAADGCRLMYRPPHSRLKVRQLNFFIAESESVLVCP